MQQRIARASGVTEPMSEPSGLLDWNDLRIFVAIANAGSFLGAARELQINQSTVSRRVEMLEARLNRRLFTRLSKGVTLTEAAMEILPYAQAVQEKVRVFEGEFNRLSKGKRPPVVIRTTEGTAYYLLVPLLGGTQMGPAKDMLHRMTGCVELPPTKLVGLDGTQQADIALTWISAGGVPPARADDRAIRLATVRFEPFVSQAYLQRRGAPGRFDELTAHDLVTLAAYQSLDESCGPWNGLFSHHGGGRVVVEWTTSLERAMVAGGGVALVPSYSPMFVKDIQALDVIGPDIFIELWMLASPSALRSSDVRSVYQFLSRAFRGFDWATRS